MQDFFRADIGYGKPHGPGPNVYRLRNTIGMPKKTDPTFWQSPAFSMRPVTNALIDTSSPGPVYKVDRVTRNGYETKSKIIMGSLLSSKEVIKSPGPAAYLPCFPNIKRTPTPKILSPLKDITKNTSPPPNTYNLREIDDSTPSPIKTRRKGYTLKWRTDYDLGETGKASPGPAAYGPTNADVHKNRAPAIALGQRFNRERHANGTSPGPQAYHVTAAECIKSCRSKFTFGVKLPNRFPPYVVPADNSP